MPQKCDLCYEIVKRRANLGRALPVTRANEALRAKLQKQIVMGCTDCFAYIKARLTQEEQAKKTKQALARAPRAPRGFHAIHHAPAAPRGKVGKTSSVHPQACRICQGAREALSRFALGKYTKPQLRQMLTMCKRCVKTCKDSTLRVTYQLVSDRLHKMSA